MRLCRPVWAYPGHKPWRQVFSWRGLVLRKSLWYSPTRAASWQNQRNGMYAQWRLRTAWASAQSDQSPLCAQWVAKDPKCRHADSEDWSDWADTQADLCLRWMHRSFSWFCHAAVHVIQDNTTILVACFDWLFHCTCTYIFCFACLIGCSSVHGTYIFCCVCLALLFLHFLFLSVSIFVSLSLILTFFVFVCFNFCFIVPYTYIFCFVCLIVCLAPLFLYFLFLSVSIFVSLSLILTFFFCLFRF